MENPGGTVISVVAPAFNESETIEKVVREWVEALSHSGHCWEIVIADDGSDDGTADVIGGIGDSRVRVVCLPVNKGYGYALDQAMRNSTGDILITIDSDGQFNLRDGFPLVALLREEELDLVSGYRRNKKDTVFRVAADRVLNMLMRLFFGLRFRDTNCALKAMTRRTADLIDIEATGFPAPTEIMARAAHLNCRLAELPVDHLPRAGSKSKLKSLQSTIHFMFFLVYLRLQLSLRQRQILQE